jgi:hypothetical protein
VRGEGLWVYEGFFGAGSTTEPRFWRSVSPESYHPAGGVPPDVAPRWPFWSPSLRGFSRRVASIGCGFRKFWQRGFQKFWQGEEGSAVDPFRGRRSEAVSGKGEE